MALVDKDVVFDKINKAYGEGNLINLKQIINNIPTVDAVPIVHGKWLHDESGANFCSECMKYAYEDEEYHMILHTKYCPHCGARMDGENDE